MDRQEIIHQRRREITQKMLGIASMRRGTLNEQFLPVAPKGCKTPVLRGPYYVFSRKEHGVTVSQRVPASEVERVREDIARYEQFMGLCKEFAEATEELGALDGAGSASEQRLKKGLKSRSSRARKSRG